MGNHRATRACTPAPITPGPPRSEGRLDGRHYHERPRVKVRPIKKLLQRPVVVEQPVETWEDFVKERFREICIHEAGHMVAWWVTDQNLPYPHCPPDRIVLRRLDEEGLLTTLRGTEHDNLGIVERCVRLVFPLPEALLKEIDARRLPLLEGVSVEDVPPPMT